MLLPYGGFDHNAQSLRIVTKLERRYADFDGINLTWESLEGLVKHNGPLLTKAGAGTRGPVPQPILDYCEIHDLELIPMPASRRRSPRSPMISPITRTTSTMGFAPAI